MSPNPEYSSEQERRDQWDASSPTRERIRRGYDSYYHGAFTAFLTLPGIELDSHGLLEEFERRHLGSFATIQEACQEYLRSIGWLAATDRYLAVIPSETSPIFWDYRAIAQQLEQTYQVIPHEGEIHVFTRRA